ncbi:MAG: diguanylate cyclase/phosphodiesterase (GGDEF & EAL domain) with PAS/PAC sensor [Gammaproteobacteria bacterium]|nr:diguanylate cyclase/phosphodiesterase (GGDEF & EAL domain) with PAS/PAC sensor [Gammaproteobacteria bacterium]
MEEYDDREVETDWLESVRQGQIFIDKEPYTDDYGVFVSGSAPLFDSQGNYAGILGIDIDVSTFFLVRNRVIIDTAITSLIALILSVIVGFLRYRNRKYKQDIRNLEYSLIFTDTLTGIFNRRYYNELIQNEWVRYKRYKTRYSIAILDIDYFKMVNDNHGHVAGDKVLVYFVEQIKNGIRDTDALVRIGGEEFLIFMPNTDEAEAVNLSKRINNRIATNSVTVDENTISITFSAGLSSVHEMDESYDETYKRADIALYHAKQSGRNKVVGSEQLPKKAFDNKQV